MTDPTRFAAPEPVPTQPVVPVSTPTPIAKPKKGGALTNALLLVAAFVALGGITFAIGRATAPASAGGFTAAGGATDRGQFPGPNGSFDPANGPGGGLFGGDRTMTVSGTVTSVDGSTLVIAAADGTETTIDVSGSTYHRQASATASDVSVGSTVQVSVEGFGRGAGAGVAPDASAAPASSGAPAAGTGTITATDVTITGAQ